MVYKSLLLFGAPGSGKGTQGKILGTIPAETHSVYETMAALGKTGEAHRKAVYSHKIGERTTVAVSAVRDFIDKYQNWQTGVNGIVIQLDKVLSELGVKKIEAVGKKFDPHFHEAVKEVESDVDDGMVVDEFQTGFELNGKVIRPSQVVISKKIFS